METVPSTSNASQKKPPQNELINVREFLDTWTGCDLLTEIDLVKACDDLDRRKIMMATEMEVSQEMFEELDAVCGENTLDCEEITESQSTSQKVRKKHQLDIPDDIDLLSVKSWRAEKKKREENADYRIQVNSQLADRYPFSHSQVTHLLKTKKEVPSERFVDLPEVLLEVQIYKPSKVRAQVSQQYHVIGQQKLTELRDLIICPSDHMVPGECSLHPDLPVEVRAKDLYKSGFFYIEGVFYNDLRDPNNRDYSKMIITWAHRDPSRGMGPFDKRNMEDTKFEDINIRLGYPYVYIHQGNCEHLMVFTDIRLLHPEDCNDIKEYPMLIGLSTSHRVTCRVCSTRTASWMTQASPLSPEDPCFFCETCFKMLHYDAQGKKLAEFKAYHYTDSITLTFDKKETY